MECKPDDASELPCVHTASEVLDVIWGNGILQLTLHLNPAITFFSCLPVSWELIIITVHTEGNGLLFPLAV